MLTRVSLVLLCGLCVWSRAQVLDFDSWAGPAVLSGGLCRYGNSVECCWGWRQTDQGRCEPHCQQGCKHGDCVGPDRCKCHPGYTGKACNHDLNECGLKPRPCKHRCMNTPGSYKCYCLDGHTLQPDGSCRNARTCYHANCQYGCEAIKGAVRCTCPSPGLRLGPDGRTCVDVDECVLGRAACPRRRKCVNTFGSFLCKCHLGFKLLYVNGRYACTDKDARPFCSLNPSSPKCRCEDGSCEAPPKVTVEPPRPRTLATTTTTTTTMTTVTITTPMTTTTTSTTPTTTTMTTTTPTTTMATTPMTTPTTTTMTTTMTSTTPTTTTMTTTMTTMTTTTKMTTMTTTTPTTTTPATTSTMPVTTATPPPVTTTDATPPPTTLTPTTVVTEAAPLLPPTATATPVITTPSTTSPSSPVSTTSATTGTGATATAPTAAPPATTVAPTATMATTATTTVNSRVTKDVTNRQRGDVHIPRQPSHNHVWEFDIELGNTADYARDDPGVGVLRCTFDHGACDWMSDREGDLRWETARSAAGGWYLAVPELKAGQNSIRGARLAAQIVPSWSYGSVCFSFSHWLTGHHIGVLQLFVRTKGRNQRFSTALWSRTGGHGWRRTQVTLTTVDRVLLKAERRQGRRGKIAIDDVTLRQGACR